MSPWVEYEIGYYLRALDDVSLLERAVVIEEDDPFVQTFCVPVGGTRRSGSCGYIGEPGAAQYIVEHLHGRPDFPHVRISERLVEWGDELPELPDCDDNVKVFHQSWLYGHSYGYSLSAIVFQLGRDAARAVCPQFYELESSANGGEQIRSGRG